MRIAKGAPTNTFGMTFVFARDGDKLVFKEGILGGSSIHFSADLAQSTRESIGFQNGLNEAENAFWNFVNTGNRQGAFELRGNYQYHNAYPGYTAESGWLTKRKWPG